MLIPVILLKNIKLGDVVRMKGELVHMEEELVHRLEALGDHVKRHAQTAGVEQPSVQQAAPVQQQGVPQPSTRTAENVQLPPDPEVIDEPAPSTVAPQVI